MYIIGKSHYCAPIRIYISFVRNGRSKKRNKTGKKEGKGEGVEKEGVKRMGYGSGR